MPGNNNKIILSKKQVNTLEYVFSLAINSVEEQFKKSVLLTFTKNGKAKILKKEDMLKDIDDLVKVFNKNIKVKGRK